MCELANTESNRLLLKVAACSGLSGKDARRRYGIENISTNQKKIDDAFNRAAEIRTAVLDWANMKEKAVLQTLGYDCTSGDSEKEDECNLEEVEDVEWISSSEDETECSHDMPTFRNQNRGVSSVPVSDCITSTNSCSQIPKTSEKKGYVARPRSFDPDDTDVLMSAPIFPEFSKETLLLMLRENDLNWFSFAKELQAMLPFGNQDGALQQILLDFADYIPMSDLTSREEQLAEVSRQAYLEIQRKQSLSDEVFETDSESEDDDWLEINDILSDEAKVLQERTKIRKAAKREVSRKIAQEAPLQRKITKMISTILTKYPDVRKWKMLFANTGLV